MLLSLFVKNNLLTILCTRAGARGGGLGREHLVCCVFLLLLYFCFVFVSYRLETKF